MVAAAAASSQATVPSPANNATRTNRITSPIIYESDDSITTNTIGGGTDGVRPVPTNYPYLGLVKGNMPNQVSANDISKNPLYNIDTDFLKGGDIMNHSSEMKEEEFFQTTHNCPPSDVISRSVSYYEEGPLIPKLYDDEYVDNFTNQTLKQQTNTTQTTKSYTLKRSTSSEWAFDTPDETSLGHVHPYMILDSSEEIDPLLLPSSPFSLDLPFDTDVSTLLETNLECTIPQELPTHLIVQKSEPVPYSTPISTSSSAVKRKYTPFVPTKYSKRRKKNPRVLDFSHHLKPTKNDVLLGRGASTNGHAGNMTFRRKALELRAIYNYGEQSKSEKERIARELVQFVLNRGRFLEKGDDGFWYEVVSGYHAKASQQLRDAAKRVSK